MKPIKLDLVDLVRQSESFVVRDYTHCSNDPSLVGQPIVAVIPADALFEVIQDAHANNKKLTIAPVGPPIIDWS